MAGLIARQPNGLYCRFSTIVDTFTDYNMTEADYIRMCQERAVQEAKDVLENHLHPFEYVVELFHPFNMSKKEFKALVAKMSAPPAKEARG